MLTKKFSFFIGKEGGGGVVFAERNVTQEEGSREQTWQSVVGSKWLKGNFSVTQLFNRP